MESRFFCRHLVALCVRSRLAGSPPTSKPRFHAYPGTIVRFRDRYFFLTAGHSIEQLNEALESNEIEIHSVELADNFGLEPISDLAIPFDLRNSGRFFVDDEDDGLDFGLIALAPYYVRLLARNGIIAIEEKNWIHQGSLEFDKYWMLGLPEEFTTNDGTVSPTMISITRVLSPPNDVAATRYERFVALLPDDLPLDSVVGMSGGPIFGFRLTEAPDGKKELRYWIVALQSRWNRQKRMVFGCPVLTFMTLLEKWLAEIDSTEGQLGPESDEPVTGR